MLNTKGNFNTAIGTLALDANTTGSDNTAVGNVALYKNTTDFANSATGYYAMGANTTGSNNTASGYVALYSNTTGKYNTATGNNALYSNTTGKKNTGIGNKVDVTNGNFTNSTALDNEAMITASNQVRIGNYAVTSIGGFANWSNISDARVKKNVRENVPGLPFINKLKAITYNLGLNAADKIIAPPVMKTKEGEVIKPEMEDLADRKAKEQIIYKDIAATVAYVLLLVFTKHFWQYQMPAITFAPQLFKLHLSRKAEGYGPVKPWQPRTTAKGANSITLKA